MTRARCPKERVKHTRYSLTVYSENMVSWGEKVERIKTYTHGKIVLVEPKTREAIKVKKRGGNECENMKGEEIWQ